MDEEEEEEAQPSLPAELVAQFEAAAKQLGKARRKAHKQAKKSGTALVPPAATLKMWEQVATATPHATSRGAVTDVCVHPTHHSLVLSAGVDRTARVFDSAAGAVAGSLSGHSKKVTSVAAAPGDGFVAATTSADKTVRVWAGEDAGGCRA